MRIRRVNLEFLRAGPPHNQLLSPLTQYLGICGESGAGVVTVPYEHASFLRRLKDLRYDEENSDQRRLDVLQQTGVDMAQVLGSVPGFEGSLNGNFDRNDLVHLRLTISASELALLPFELSKMPHGREQPGDNWLALQTQVALCITRHIRSVSSDGVNWSTPPRILFVAGDPSNIPFEEHRDTLNEIIKPWEGRNGSNKIKLTVIENASIEKVTRACREADYTHIHVLAHGDTLPSNPDKYGICLDDTVIPGEQFATAIASLKYNGVHRPTVVTVASCDSGQVGSVITRGASFAHELHQSGIPLVVASQFPLSKEGSIVLTRTLYRELLLGENPLITLHRVRTELHSVYSASSHDWASLVVYEALPLNMDVQLHKFQYDQATNEVEAALARMDEALNTSTLDASVRRELVTAVEQARDRLPKDGPYTTECLGLRASIAKRLAYANFRAALATHASDRELFFYSCHQFLQQAAKDYTAACERLVDTGNQAQFATSHWVVVQKLSVETVLGKALSAEYRKKGEQSAELNLQHADSVERAWAHASLAELSLLALADPELGDSDCELLLNKVMKHVRQILDISHLTGDFPVASTWRQFKRYVEWWGNKSFEEQMQKYGLPSKKDWRRSHGLLEAAEAICKLLEPRGQADRSRQMPPVATTDGEQAVEASVARTNLVHAVVPDFLGKRRNEDAYFSIDMLPARNGDCLWVEFGDRYNPTRLLIDCGVQAAYQSLRQRIEELPEAQRHFELFVLSHIDSDHIGGAIPFLKGCDPGMLPEVWFNGWQQIEPYFLGAKQGEMFSTLLRDGKFNWNPRTKGKAIVTDDANLPTWDVAGMKLTLLSPTPKTLAALSKAWDKEVTKLGLTPGSKTEYREFLRGAGTTSTNVSALAESKFTADTGAPNGSSIAFLAEFEGKSALFAADAHAPVLVQSIRKLLKERQIETLRIDAFKLPHHGSAKNLNIELLKLLDCQKYLVSSDGTTFHHPDREAIARVIKYGGKGCTLYFNYYTEFSEVWGRKDLQSKYGYTAVFPPPDQEGLQVLL